MEAGTLVAGRFEIVAEAGRGGMASVDRALDRETGQSVAVKVLHMSMEDVGERFRREAEVLAKMRHPGIVAYVAHGETPDGRAFLAMSWIEGETLSARLRRVGKLDAIDVLDLGAHVADALAAAHAVGIVHRDVKPSNLVLASGGFDKPILVDFGVARVGQAASSMTQEGMLIGTPGYISPEQARGLLTIDARADQFALGCVLHACFTGRAPFRGEDLVGVLAKILFQETPHVRSERPDVPAEVDAILAKAMGKEPDERFADATAMARALRSARARLGGDALPSSPTLASQTPTASGISAREARLAAMVIVGRASASPEQASLDDATFIGQRFGGDVERLANGALALRFIEAASATERALAAARCALALRQRLPTTPISLATVRGSGSDDDVVKAIDRAAELVREAPRSARAGVHPVRIDETTAGLLDARFDVRRDEAGLELVGESGSSNEARDESRKLLGASVPCLGRDRELLTLDATLDEVQSERISRAIVVTAEAGIGKSRLRREWMHRVREHGGDVNLWIARADPLDSRAPHGLLGQAVRRALAIADDAPQAAKQARLRAHLEQLLDDDSVGRVFPFASEIIGAPLGEGASDVLSAARRDRVLMAEQLRRAFEEWIVAECTKPLLIVLDDAHWSDAATLRLLDAALKAASDHPLFVAVFARPALRAAHPTLFAERRMQELRLEELSKRSSERLVRSILGSSASADVVDRVVTLANGNAFFLEELVRAVAEGKGARLPESVLSVVEARLEALEPDARRVLRAASVFGQFFWPSGVAAVLGDTDEEAANAWIGTLARREIVASRSQSRFGDEPELTFRHVFVRDTVYSMLTPEDRKLAHRAAAHWLEARGEGEAAVLGAHLEAGGDLARASTQYLRAAEHMLGGGELASAREVAARGLGCEPSDETRAELLILDAEISRWLGDVERAVRASEDVLVFAKAGSATHTRALAVGLLSHLKLGHEERYRELLVMAMHYLEHAAPSDTACRLAAGAGVGAIFQGDLVTAHAIDAIVERLVAAPEVDAAARGELHVFRAFLSDATSDLEGQIRHFDAAASYYDQMGYERHTLLHRTNAAFARTLIGDYEDAAKRLFEVLAVAERHGLEFVVDTAHADLAATLERLGRLDEAREHADRAVAGFRREGDQRMEAASRGYLALALDRLGKTAHAFTEINAAVELARKQRQVLPFLLASLANMEVGVGRAVEGLAHAAEALAALRETRNDDAHEIYVRMAHARALEAVGRTEDAHAAFERAYVRLRARVALVRDARFSECFARIEDNAALFEWALRDENRKVQAT